eukprot:6972549-Heterocapsa_arctica.AAC.1
MARAGAGSSIGVLESEERARWHAVPVSVIKDAGLPIGQEAADALDPDRFLMHDGKGRRSSTPRQQLKVWLRAVFWLCSCYRVGWPGRATQVIDYHESRALEEGCGHTTFRSVLGAWSFIETAGGIAPELRLTSSPLIHYTIKDLEVELASGKVRGRRQAHRGLVA